MMTLTGNYVLRDLGAMSLEDIALGLSRMPRYGGQTFFDWHVSDHVVCATRYLERLIRLGMSTHGTTALLPLHVLLHDAHEAMTGDIPTCFKTPDMKALQKQLDVRIYDSLAMPMPGPMSVDIIKQIDKQMLLAEAKVATPASTYEKICWEVKDIAMPIAVATVEEHIHNEVDARQEFLDIAYSFMGGNYAVTG